MGKFKFSQKCGAVAGASGDDKPKKNPKKDFTNEDVDVLFRLIIENNAVIEGDGATSPAHKRMVWDAITKLYNSNCTGEVRVHLFFRFFFYILCILCCIVLSPVLVSSFISKGT